MPLERGLTVTGGRGAVIDLAGKGNPLNCAVTKNKGLFSESISDLPVRTSPAVTLNKRRCYKLF